MNNPESVAWCSQLRVDKLQRLYFLANAMFTYHDEQELHAASRARRRPAAARRGGAARDRGAGVRGGGDARGHARRRRACTASTASATRRPAARAGRPGTITVTSTTLIHKDKRSLHTTWNTSIAMIFSRSLTVTSGLSGMCGWKDSERPFQAPAP